MPEQEVIRILIVDDHDMLKEGLAVFIDSQPDLQLVGEASTGLEAIDSCRELKPDVVLMDLIMPEMDGVTAIKTIHKELPQIQIIALTSFEDHDLVHSAIKAGASGYLLKNVSAGRLAEAIRSARAGLLTFAPEVAGHLLSQERVLRVEDKTYNLTSRELEVLALICKGFSNQEISQKCSISKFTVKNHVSNILSKLGVNSRTEAVSLALQKELVLLD